MDTDYIVHVVRPVAVDAHSGQKIPSAKWFPAKRAAKLPLTGVTRKILRRALRIE
jgi:hypothetical protein